MRNFVGTVSAVVLFAFCSVGSLAAQVTTSSIGGIVTDDAHMPLAGATVVAVHVPSGTTYSTRTRADGRLSIPGMRVGGPYKVTVTYIGFRPGVQEIPTLDLGVSTDLTFTMSATAVVLEAITVTGGRDPIFSSERTGAATSVTREALATLPTISGRIESVARLTPQSGGGMSFAGQDSRLNNITIDGSYFNNSFGLGNTPGDRTGVAPISLQAIEQVSINIAPYDVRQGNFVGAAVNAVTRSGTNHVAGSFGYSFRDQSLVGTQAGTNVFNPGTFNYKLVSGWLSGPIIQNKLFFFVNLENEALEAPGTTFLANTGGQAVTGSTTRVLASDLDALSTFLKTNFQYDPGAYTGYSNKTPATRGLVKLDYNINDRNKLSVRYTHLNSNTDVLLSNSSSLGFGTRRTNLNGLNYQNSNYVILENIRSVVGEWNAKIGSNTANNFIIGYTYNNESRDPARYSLFPFVDILNTNTVYTSFGFEPFTPNNELYYNSFQIQNNLMFFRNKHTITLGAGGERYKSTNIFFPGSQSVYVYNSLADFYTDANGYLANPTRTTSPITLNRFQVRWNNIAGQTKPVQPLQVLYGGVYAQDEWRVSNGFKLTAGIRLDVPVFGQTGYANAIADAQSFRDETGASVQYSTKKLPDPKLLLSPRVGINWDVTGKRSTQIRGGTGIFTGRPPYVWISNQIGNTGVLTGFEQLLATTARPFHPDPDHYKKAATGAPPASYQLALTDPSFKFPQVWRSNIGIDQKLGWGMSATLEYLYNRDVNGAYYINANLPVPDAPFVGADARPRYSVDRCPATAGTQILLNCNVTDAVVLKNQNTGRSWNLAGSLEKAFSNGFFAKAAYSYGESKNTVDAGSIAFGSWNGNPHPGDPNNPGLGFSGASPGSRVFVALSYRKEYFKFGATSVSLFWEARTIGNTSYVFGGDMNGDGGTANDLIYIPRDQSEMNFQQFTVTGGPTFTVQQQNDAWEAYIVQDKYLSANRGQYAVRGAVFLPMIKRADFSVSQELFASAFTKRNTLQIRVDVLNVGNLLNNKWGIGQRLVSTQPLLPQGVDGTGRALYRLRAIGVATAAALMTTSYEPTAGFDDVFRLQIGLRYTFN
ncbi:MAG: TonB-dependent receptor [Gemmatimonadetes bacterium]|nr:TonB-dependent receptor [Gemmatimonadota bacterium]